jgi:hypothetical protein
MSPVAVCIGVEDETYIIVQNYVGKVAMPPVPFTVNLEFKHSTLMMRNRCEEYSKYIETEN